jgi:hypothetical protein
MQLREARPTPRRLLVALAIVIVLYFPARWFWVLNGGRLPSLTALRHGMTRNEVESVTGPPTWAGQRPDGSSWMIVTRPESLAWIELDFDAVGRLRLFKYERF